MCVGVSEKEFVTKTNTILDREKINNLNIPDTGTTVQLKTIPYSGVRITKELLVPQYTRAGKDRQP